jgi:hypothetical protein
MRGRRGIMNQDQRKYLIEQVHQTCKEQTEKLEEKIPEKPSLNNYIVAAFLDNSIKFANIDTLKKKMRASVLKLGVGQSLIEAGDRGYRHRDLDEKDVVKVIAEDIFVIPQNYIDALKEYEDKKKLINDKIETLRNTEKTITLKLQIGSAVTLDKLIMQVDNMGDLNLVNTQLLLGDGEK